MKINALVNALQDITTLELLAGLALVYVKLVIQVLVIAYLVMMGTFLIPVHASKSAHLHNIILKERVMTVIQTV
jgi:hypothetical protein